MNRDSPRVTGSLSDSRERDRIAATHGTARDHRGVHADIHSVMLGGGSKDGSAPSACSPSAGVVGAWARSAGGGGGRGRSRSGREAPPARRAAEGGVRGGDVSPPGCRSRSLSALGGAPPG